VYLRKLVSSVVALSVLSLPGVCQAQAVPSATTEAASSPTNTPIAMTADARSASQLDTVRLKNGAFFRGTLLEWEPASHAVLQLHDGSVRRFANADIAEVTSQPEAAARMPASTVQRALDGAPTASTPPPLPSSDNHLRLTVTTARGDALFVRGPGDQSARLLCSTGCVSVIPKGPYLLGLSRRGREPLMADGTTMLDRDTHVEGTLHSARAARIWGGSILATGLAGAIWLTQNALAERRGRRCDGYDKGECEQRAESDTMPRLAAGVFVGALSTIIGIFLVTRKNKVEFETHPDDSQSAQAASVSVEPAPEPR